MAAVRLCVTNLPLDPDSELVRIGIYTYGKAGQPLEVTANAPGYAFTGMHPGGFRSIGEHESRQRRHNQIKARLAVNACVKLRGAVGEFHEGSGPAVQEQDWETSVWCCGAKVDEVDSLTVDHGAEVGQLV